MLDELAAFEHTDVGEAVGPHVHDHQVATRGTALAARSPAPLQRLLVEGVEQRGAVDVDVAELARVDVLDGAAARAAPRAGGRAVATATAAATAVRRRRGAALTATLAAAAATAPAATLLGLAVGTDGTRSPLPLPAREVEAGAAGAGRLSPIFGRPGGRGRREPRVLPGLLGDVVVGQAAVGALRRPVLAARHRVVGIFFAGGRVVVGCVPAREGGPARGAGRVPPAPFAPAAPPLPLPAGFLRP